MNRLEYLRMVLHRSSNKRPYRRSFYKINFKAYIEFYKIDIQLESKQ